MFFLVLGHLDQFCAHQAIVYFLSSFANKCSPNNNRGGAAIAQWIHLRLPSCHSRFETQANHLSSYLIYSQIYLSLYCEKYENKQKEAGFGPFKKNKCSPNKTKGHLNFSLAVFCIWRHRRRRLDSL